MFVGDSLQRGQWQSFVCLVDSVIPSNQKSMRRGRSHSIFTIKVLIKCIGKFSDDFLRDSVFNIKHFHDSEIQCHSWVLLGTISCRIQFRSADNRRPEAENFESGFNWKTCQKLGKCGHTCVQHLCLVDEWLEDQVIVSTHQKLSPTFASKKLQVTCYYQKSEFWKIHFASGGVHLRTARKGLKS